MVTTDTRGAAAPWTRASSTRPQSAQSPIAAASERRASGRRRARGERDGEGERGEPGEGRARRPQRRRRVGGPEYDDEVQGEGDLPGRREWKEHGAVPGGQRLGRRAPQDTFDRESRPSHGAHSATRWMGHAPCRGDSRRRADAVALAGVARRERAWPLQRMMGVGGVAVMVPVLPVSSAGCLSLTVSRLSATRQAGGGARRRVGAGHLSRRW